MKYVIGIWNPFHRLYEPLRNVKTCRPVVVEYDDIRHIRMSYSSFVGIPCTLDW